MKKKNIIDYLKEHENNRTEFTNTSYNHTIKEFEHTDVTLTLVEYGIHIYIDGELERFVNLDDDCEYIIQDFLFDEYGIDIRFCDHCGCPMQAGYTDDDADFYNCEECFPKDMDERYGKGNWRTYEERNGDCNNMGGYYEYLENGEWRDEPSYYTEWC